MKVLILGLSIFCIALGLHLIIWRIRIQKGQTKALSQIFLGSLFVSLLILWFVPKFFITFNVFLLNEISEYLRIIIFFISLMLAYITTYSAIEVDSPTFIIMMNIAQAGSGGFQEEEFKEIINDDLIVKTRIKDLLEDKIIYLNGDKFKLTGKGFLIAGLFKAYRRLLNAQKGG